MEENKNKETFKLLQISDDSKSLSDLDLPEFVTQKKRKIRRKTRPRPSTQKHNSVTVNNVSQCNRLTLWLAIFLTSCWLLTLSYMIAIIHAENLRLEVLIKKSNKKNTTRNGVNYQDQLLSPSTDEQEDFGWPKVIRNSNRNRHRKFSFIRLCAPLVFVACISLSLGFMYWLYFDLRQQLYEYRQKIEEVTVTSQNLPETLQKWHETSKSLEQNQTIIYGKIYELQHSLENLNGDFSKYKNKLLNNNKDISKDEKFVANFGAKIEAVTVDVENMKEKFNQFQKNQDIFKDDINKLKNNFTNVLNKAESLNNNSETKNYSTDIENLKNQAFEKLTSLSNNISIMNDVMSQKIKGLDDELIKHKKVLDDLFDSSANATSHVTSIEEDWTKYKEKFNQYEIFKNEIKIQIIDLKNITTDLDNALRDVRSTFNKFRFDVLQNFETIKMKKPSDAQMNAKLNNDEFKIDNLLSMAADNGKSSNAQSVKNIENKINTNRNTNTNTNNNNNNNDNNDNTENDNTNINNNNNNNNSNNNMNSNIKKNIDINNNPINNDNNNNINNNNKNNNNNENNKNKNVNTNSDHNNPLSNSKLTISTSKQQINSM